MNVKAACGTWAWGNDGTFGAVHTPEELRPVFETAMRLGLRCWDTAYVYGMGTAERTLAGFLKGYPRDAFFIADKFTPQHACRQSASPFGDTYRHQLEIMGLDRFDLYWVHNALEAPRWTRAAAQYFAGRPDAPMIGVSNHNLAQIIEADRILREHGLRLAAVQNHYSLLSRASERRGILEYCRAHDITFYAYMVLEQGALTGRFDEAHPMPAGSGRGRNCNPVMARYAKLNEKIAEIAGHYDVPPAQIPIAWAAAKGAVPIVGVTAAGQAEDAAQAVQLKMDPADMRALEEYADSLHIGVNRVWEKNVT
jgi:aryl-alcohol dehydrogenase-like predicted oxidoreductase